MKLARRLVCAAKQQFLPLPDSLSGIRELRQSCLQLSVPLEASSQLKLSRPGDRTFAVEACMLRLGRRTGLDSRPGKAKDAQTKSPRSYQLYLAM